MTNVRFEKVSLRRTCKFKCSGCGKRRTRTFIVTHTVNPFNVDESGVPKSRERVTADVLRELKEAIADIGHVCRSCE